MIRQTTIALAALLLVITSGAGAQEMVDHPVYKSWAAHKVGTTVKYEMKISMQGQQIPMTNTQKLLEVTEESITVESATSMQMMGMTQNTPPTTQKYPAKIAKDKVDMSALPPDTTGTAKMVGNETITVLGKSYDCKVMEFTGQAPTGKVSGKTWVSDQVPSTIVKTQSKTEGADASDFSMTLTDIQLK